MKLEEIYFNKTIILFLLCGVSKLINAAQVANNSSTTNPLWEDNDVDKLKRDLLANYDKFSTPFENQVIDICFKTRHINIDEHQGIFKIVLRFGIHWYDQNLVWNSDEYNDLSTCNFGRHEIWEPEIISFNSIDPSAETYDDTLLIVSNNGEVKQFRIQEYNVFCDMNFSLWPYDKQNCSIKLGTWASHNIEFSVNHNCLNGSRDIFNIEWDIEQIYSMNGTDPVTKFDYVEITFQLKRYSPLYEIIIITPTSCIVLMILSGFWLPPQCGEKILLNGINAILLIAFLMYFGRLLPVLADNTPLIVLFLSSSLLLVSISMIISVLVIYIADINHEKRLPKWLRNILNGSIGKILCLSHLSTNSTIIPNTDEDEPKFDGNSSHEPQIFELSTPSVPLKSIQNDWIIFAAAIDRISFLIYCIIFSVLAIKYSV